MSEQENTKKIDNNPNSDEYVIDVTKIISTLWLYKYLLVGLTGIGAVLSIIIALNLSIIHTSVAVIIPNESNSSSRLASQFGGLASIAGIDAGEVQLSPSQIAIARISSLDFFKKRLYEEVVVDLSASMGWDTDTSQLIYDEDIYDFKKGIWIQDRPTHQQAYESFEGLIDIVENKITGLTTIRVEHYSPFIAKKWLDLMLKEINSVMREEDKKEASLAIEFYKKELANVKIKSIRDLFSELLEEEQKTLMLSNIREEYTFKIIEPPVVPEKRTRPARTKFVVIYTFVSGLLSIALILVYDFFQRNRRKLFNFKNS
jgi:hypothetical protein